MQSPGVAIARGSRAFTLIDVLVTIAVIGVLISILAPSLSSVRETAQQVICRSNVRQLGIGIDLYAEDYKGAVPASKAIDFPSGSVETMTLRFGAAPAGYSNHWDGLGNLYSLDYLPAPKLYYCPSHKGNNPFARYADQWAGRDGIIVGNYQYRGHGPVQTAHPVGMAPVPQTTVLASMRPGAALVSDGLRSQSDFNHVVGANVLRSDLSVNWFNDNSGRLFDGLSKDGQPPNPLVIDQAWSELDNVR